MVPLTAGVLSFVWCWLAPRSRLGRILTDDPSGDELKVHQQPIPPIGGPGIYLALVPAMIQVGDVAIWLAASAALGLGMLDDKRSLTPQTRLVSELFIGIALAVSPAVATGWLGRVVVVAATVVLINAVNLYDGLDGLVGGAIAVSAAGVGLINDSVIGYSLSTALIAFLVFNWHPATLFLGDSGAYLGAVALVAAASTGGPSDISVQLVSYGMAGVVLVDLAVTLIRRARAGAPLFRGDRSHLYDQLVDRGWRVPAVAATSAVVQMLIVGIAILSLELAEGTITVVVMAAVLVGLLGLASASGFTSSDR